MSITLFSEVPNIGGTRSGFLIETEKGCALFDTGQSGEVLSHNLEELEQQAELHFSDPRVEVLPGPWTTGEVLERLEPEGHSPNHFIQADEEWCPYPYRDDMSLVMATQEGPVIICGCCHAGLLNTLAHVKKEFQRPIIAFLGGTHLVTVDETYLGHVSNVLR